MRIDKREYDRKWRALNRDKINARRRELYAKAPEKLRASRKRWRAKNHEKARVAAARYRATHPEKYRAAALKYYEKNRQRELATRRRRAAAIADLITVLRVEMPELLKEFGL